MKRTGLFHIFSRSDIRAGSNWRNRDHGFEDNSFDKWCTGRKARMHIASRDCP